jgi:hypothetical protein
LLAALDTSIPTRGVAELPPRVKRTAGDSGEGGNMLVLVLLQNETVKMVMDLYQLFTLAAVMRLKFAKGIFGSRRF